MMVGIEALSVGSRSIAGWNFSAPYVSEYAAAGCSIDQILVIGTEFFPLARFAMTAHPDCVELIHDLFD
jgi:hypothetical protein